MDGDAEQPERGSGLAVGDGQVDLRVLTHLRQPEQRVKYLRSSVNGLNKEEMSHIRYVKDDVVVPIRRQCLLDGRTLCLLSSRHESATDKVSYSYRKW